MSYPRAIQVLVVEDEQEAKQAYDAIFDALGDTSRSVRYEAIKPRYAFCYEEAVEALAANRAYHLVILDLRLPEKPLQPAVEGQEYGIRLLQECARRDAYPIPALLIISGHLGKTDQTQLAEQTRSSFFHGRVLAKGVSLSDDIEAALGAVHSYCDVGIHLRDGGEGRYPTLAPRDEDLLRRCVLGKASCVGLDIKWWSAEYSSPPTENPGYGGWTKILNGRFLCGEGAGVSRPAFFKLSPAADAEVIFRAARMLELKLSHVKVLASLASGDTSLLVTQKVGAGQDDPVSLADFLSRPVSDVHGQMSSIAAGIAGQVRELGDVSPDQQQVGRLLWKCHDTGKIGEQWERWRDRGDGTATNPARVLQMLQQSQTIVPHKRQGVLHGDLNITNVALDVDTDGAKAYILDPGGCHGGVNIRDLAVLEVTALLHQSPSPGENLIEALAPLYQGDDLLPEGVDMSQCSDRAHNTYALIVEIRRRALARADKQVYALMVFDAALVQLGGLAFAVSRNKITEPAGAAKLATLAADWLGRVAPEFFAGVSVGEAG